MGQLIKNWHIQNQQNLSRIRIWLQILEDSITDIILNIVISMALNMLPKRNAGSYLKGYDKMPVKTNLYKVEFSDKTYVTIFSLAIKPQLPADSTKIHTIVGSVDQQLINHLGNYQVCGKTIYTCQLPQADIMETIIKLQAKCDNENYSLVITPLRVIDLAALYSTKHAQAILSLNFLNNLMKKFFSTLKYVSIGKNGKYFNPKSRHVLSNSGIILFNGYETKFNIAESGVYLQVDSMVRIVQSRTVLQEIDQIYSKHSHLSKDQKRQAVKAQLIGRPIMANYGNSRIWIITEILFDFDLENTKIGKDNNTNFIEYYQKSYGLKITKKKQPVLKAVMNGIRRQMKDGAIEPILIPQFFLMSGLPDDFDQRKRRQISQFTIINPEEKLKRIQQLVNQFNNGTDENFSANSVSQNLGVKISKVTQTVDATILPPPIIQLGKNDSVEKNKVASFQLFNKQVYKHDVPVNIVVLMPHDYDFEQIEKLFSTTCRNLCIRHTLNTIRINFQDSKKCMLEIQKYIEDKEGKYDDYDLNWFILPPNMKSHYKTIKKLSLKAGNPKATQVALTSTLAKKGFASILTKVLLQIASKVGNVPWAPRVPSAVPQKTILIGVDSCKQGKNNIVTYCCTINKQMCKFHSNYHYEPIVANYSTKMGEIVADCLAAYSKTNSFLPDQIIIIKSDISDGEKDNIVKGEITQIKNKLKDMNGYLPKLTFITANKNSKQKFFSQGRTAINPTYGTLINSKIVSKYYDFYLIAQHCNRGTVKPIHYKVLFTDSKMEQGVLQELIYCQSFNYMNWSGSVRVPSVLQYATKLSCFVADHIGKGPETDELNGLLYFI